MQGSAAVTRADEGPTVNPMSATRAVFIHSPEIERYHYPPDCPFTTERAALTRNTLISMGLLSGDARSEVAPVATERDTLLGFHTTRYLDALQNAPEGYLDVEYLQMGLGTPDCPIFRGMYEYAALACGGSLKGAELILMDETDVAFNPSGGYHHAHPGRASGFCYMNDVALACMALAGRGRKVLFVDIDAHHADGVQGAFYDRRDVMTISFHESGRTLFPGTGFVDEIGSGEGEGFSVNVPLPLGTYDEPFLDAFHQIALPLIEAYEPDVLVLELGMDALASDPLTHLALTNNAHSEVISLLRGYSKPLLVTGGGGYHVENTVRSWALGWSVMSGQDTDEHPALELRDRKIAPHADQVAVVVPYVESMVRTVKASIFPIHGLPL